MEKMCRECPVQKRVAFILGVIADPIFERNFRKARKAGRDWEPVGFHRMTDARSRPRAVATASVLWTGRLPACGSLSPRKAVPQPGCFAAGAPAVSRRWPAIWEHRPPRCVSGVPAVGGAVGEGQGQGTSWSIRTAPSSLAQLLAVTVQPRDFVVVAVRCSPHRLVSTWFIADAPVLRPFFTLRLR